MTEALQALTDRIAMTDVLTKLFVYTDQSRWDELCDIVFADEVYFDGGFGDSAGPRTGRAIANDWADNLGKLDAVHHQAGNYLVDQTGDTATAHADSIAIHVKNDATQGTTRWFVGSYDLGLHRVGDSWRIH